MTATRSSFTEIITASLADMIMRSVSCSGKASLSNLQSQLLKSVVEHARLGADLEMDIATLVAAIREGYMLHEIEQVHDS